MHSFTNMAERRISRSIRLQVIFAAVCGYYQWRHLASAAEYIRLLDCCIREELFKKFRAMVHNAADKLVDALAPPNSMSRSISNPSPASLGRQPFPFQTP